MTEAPADSERRGPSAAAASGPSATESAAVSNPPESGSVATEALAPASGSSSAEPVEAQGQEGESTAPVDTSESQSWWPDSSANRPTVPPEAIAARRHSQGPTDRLPPTPPPAEIPSLPLDPGSLTALDEGDDDAVTQLGVSISEGLETAWPRGLTRGDPGAWERTTVEPQQGMLVPPKGRRGRRFERWELALLGSVCALFGAGVAATALMPMPWGGAPAAEPQQRSQALLPRDTPSELPSAGSTEVGATAPVRAEDVLAMAVRQRQSALNQLQLTLDSLSDSAGQPAADLPAMLELAQLPGLALEIASGLARLPGELGPDLLYAVWQRLPGGSRTATLLRDVLSAADVRAQASPALRVALRLRDGQACQDYLEILPEAASAGDARSEKLLEALSHADGCGDDGSVDCFPCLREGQLLTRALAAVRARPAPY